MSAPVSLQIVFGFLLFAVVFIPLERLFPRRPQPVLRAGWTTDIAYYVIGCFVGKSSDAVSTASALLIAQAIGHNGVTFAARQPGWLQFLGILILSDFLSYWFHRALHGVPLLWRFHKLHHTTEQMDWFVNVRLHPVDKWLGDCFQFIPIFCLGFADGPVLAYTIFLGFQTFLTHSNIRVNFGPLRWVIAGPQFHHWHHCNDPLAYNKNFAPHFVIFDVLFGTVYFPPDNRLPDVYGLSEDVPRTFLGQLMHPFGMRLSKQKSRALWRGSLFRKLLR